MITLIEVVFLSMLSQGLTFKMLQFGESIRENTKCLPHSCTKVSHVRLSCSMMQTRAENSSELPIVIRVANVS